MDQLPAVVLFKWAAQPQLHQTRLRLRVSGAFLGGLSLANQVCGQHRRAGEYPVGQAGEGQFTPSTNWAPDQPDNHSVPRAEVSMKIGKPIIVLLSIIVLIAAFGYLITVTLLKHNAARDGVHPSLDKAIESTIGDYLADYKLYYSNFTEVEITHKGLNSPSYPFIWAVGIKVHADGFADGQSFRPGQDEGLTFFVHTKDGWIHYRDDLWIGLELLGFWMNVYQLYGTDERTSGAPASQPTVADTCTPVPPTSTLLAASTPIETVEPTSSLRKMLLLYDDDGSRDGLAALLYLLSYPDISIQAITISYGEAHPEVYIQHMGCVLDSFGIGDIPLGAGQDMPLAGGTPFPDWLRQLSDNFWDYPLPNADNTYPFQNAPNLMVSIINQAPEPVTIFVSGPFTNLAQALQLDPAIKGNISAVYFMGGAVYVPGNITNLDRDSNNRVADWNMIADPQAAKEVFESGLELYMVPLDATNTVLFSQEDILPWRQGDDKANMVVDLYDIMFNSWGLSLAEIFDLTAAVLMVQPGSCDFQPLHLDVITDNGPTLGQTIVVPNTEPNIYVCLEPNVDQVKQNLYETFSR
jgi:inosine-uridine nucleoside N-ribohydrolase